MNVIRDVIQVWFPTVWGPHLCPYAWYNDETLGNRHGSIVVIKPQMSTNFMEIHFNKLIIHIYLFGGICEDNVLLMTKLSQPASQMKKNRSICWADKLINQLMNRHFALMKWVFINVLWVMKVKLLNAHWNGIFSIPISSFIECHNKKIYLAKNRMSA